MGYGGFLTGNVQSSSRISISQNFSPKLSGDTTAEDLLSSGEEIGISVEYVVVGGGGSGGSARTTNSRGGGGGGGGYRSNVTGETSGKLDPAEQPYLLKPGDYDISVGGAGGISVFGSILSYAGGGGASVQNGTVGGGGSAGYKPLYSGFPGGVGGGGGAGEAGGNNSSTGGKGGDGIQTSITGTPTYFAGGGGGVDFYGGPGGLGGGSYGGFTRGPGSAGGPGGQNTGGGGGGSGPDGGNWRSGGTGGSGVIIFKVPSSTSVSFSIGITEANGGSGQPIGNYKVYTVTAGTGTVTIS